MIKVSTYTKTVQRMPSGVFRGIVFDPFKNVRKIVIAQSYAEAKREAAKIRDRLQKTAESDSKCR